MHKLKNILIVGVVFRNLTLSNILSRVYKLEIVLIFSITELDFEPHLIYIKIFELVIL
jgi:hypothetical protein